MYGTEGNSFVSPKDDVTRDEVDGNITTPEKPKQISFPRDHTLSALLDI